MRYGEEDGELIVSERVCVGGTGVGGRGGRHESLSAKEEILEVSYMEIYGSGQLSDAIQPGQHVQRGVVPYSALMYLRPRYVKRIELERAGHTGLFSEKAPTSAKREFIYLELSRHI